MHLSAYPESGGTVNYYFLEGGGCTHIGWIPTASYHTPLHCIMYFFRHSVQADQPPKSTNNRSTDKSINVKSVNDKQSNDMDVVINVIADVIGVSKNKVKPEANFYELGGNSTNAVTVVVNLRKAGSSKVRILKFLYAFT